MHAQDDLHRAVEETMARIVAGDPGALWDLHRLAAPSVRRILRAEAHRVHAWISDDDLHDLTLDAAMTLAGIAASWKPDAALPWVWARRRITALVHQHLGTFTRELDDSHTELAEAPSPVAVDDPRAALRALAAHHEGAAELDRRLDAVASDRDAAVYLGFRIEQATGNRSPAVTVGADHAMEPAAVRKVVQRIGERLAAA